MVPIDHLMETNSLRRALNTPTGQPQYCLMSLAPLHHVRHIFFRDIGELVWDGIQVVQTPTRGNRTAKYDNIWFDSAIIIPSPCTAPLGGRNDGLIDVALDGFVDEIGIGRERILRGIVLEQPRDIGALAPPGDEPL